MLGRFAGYEMSFFSSDIAGGRPQIQPQSRTPHDSTPLLEVGPAVIACIPIKIYPDMLLTQCILLDLEHSDNELNMLALFAT